MNSFSGLSAILTVSLVALITVQMLKDKFEVIENYGEQDDDGNDMNNMQPHTTADTSTAKNVSEVSQNLPVHPKNLNNLPDHSLTPFVTGDFFRPPFVSKDANANGWNGFAETFAMHQQQLNMSTPTDYQLNLVGSNTDSLPGPNTFNQDSFANANVNTGRAANLNLCAQNMNTHGVGNSAVASSLLPNNSPAMNGQLEGFSDCNFTNPLANQVFLSSQNGIAGTNTVSGSNRNQNLQIRSEPPNPILGVGPWNLSTIYPDLTRRPLEGCGPSFGLYGNGPYGGGTPTSIAP
jgi:hypothetical protein